MKQEEIYHNAQWEQMEARLSMSKNEIQLEAQHQLEQVWEQGEIEAVYSDVANIGICNSDA
jgi:hypothetical protein